MVFCPRPMRALRSPADTAVIQSAPAAPAQRPTASRPSGAALSSTPRSTTPAMIAAVQPGTLRYQAPGQPVVLAAVSPGMVKVENNEVVVLVDSAERPEEIDAARAKREADQAREALLQKRSRQEHQLAQATLARALNRLRVKAAYLG